MIGVYDYTVILTYMSVASAGIGMIAAATGHTVAAGLFLVLCGLFDLLDGTVARTKKNRTDDEKKFGIQIDSLSDLTAFGIFPAVIGFTLQPDFSLEKIILVLFPLCGLIRLAYYNVQEAKRQDETEEHRKYYTGLPITVSSMVCPTLIFLRAMLPENWITPEGFYAIYLVALAALGFFYLAKVKIPKPGKVGVPILAVLAIIAIVVYFVFL